MNVAENIIKVRELMTLNELDAFVVLTEDPHCSEYPANHWKFREYLTGFNGSAGVLVITKQHVGLWVDSRYYIQAEKQMRGSMIEIFKEGMPNVPNYMDYLTYVLPSGSVVGIDGFTLSFNNYQRMKKVFAPFDIDINYKVNIIDELFAGREPLPLNEVEEMNPAYQTLSRKDKLELVRAEMLEKNISHYIVSALDDIAWLTNLRGSDVECNPVFYAYMIITPETAMLYADPHKFTSIVSHRLLEDGITVSMYYHFEPALQALPSGTRAYCDPARANVRNVLAMSRATRIMGRSIIGDLKARKDAMEMHHIREAHKYDGVAMVRFLRWLDGQMKAKAAITELDVVAKLHDLRAEHPLFMGDSFHTIAAYGANGAIVHYTPNIETNAKLKPKGMLLLDSGAQYANGTTDITRTIALGKLTDEERADYTMVLKAMISLAMICFPKGARGVHLDSIARQHLWANGADYGHGTGHGVGYCLNVHEGPQRIGKDDNGVEMEEGMLTSNEPGIYREGKHGVRIENLQECCRWQRTDMGTFLKFSVVTICPIDTRPIQAWKLSNTELDWLDDYHEMVFNELSPMLSDPEDVEWLRDATKPVRKVIRLE